jgi:phosphoglycolate phosphatase
MTGFKLAIFDWNGTLLNDLKLVYESVVAIFKAYQLPPPTLDEYRNEIEADFMKFYRAHGMPAHVTGEELNAIRKQYFQEHWQEVELQSGARQLLQLCRDLRIPITIVSGEMKEVLEDRLRQFSLAPLVNRVRGGARDKEHALADMLDTFKVDPEDTFYLDDSHDGITAAKHTGIFTIGFTGGYYSPQRIVLAKPDKFVHALQDASTILLKGGAV